MAHRDPSVDDNFLVRASVKPETLRRYLGAVSGFLLYCEERDLEAYDEWDLDRHLRTYIHHLYRAGASRQMAAYAVYGVQLLLGKRYSLHTAKRALNGWSRLEPSQPRPPMPYEVMLLSALWLGRRGGRAAGAAMVVAFHGLLRISELLGLRVGDVAGPRDPGAQRSHAAWVLALPRTKTGSNQHVVIDDPLACALLASWTTGRGSDERLFGLSDYAFRKALKEAERRCSWATSATCRTPCVTVEPPTCIRWAGRYRTSRRRADGKSATPQDTTSRLVVPSSSLSGYRLRS